MTVVDVNTGKFVGSGGNLEQTVTRNNMEAAEEIVRQLRLRDIGGIIVIDFIDMVLESNRDLVLRRLTECLGRDRTKHQVAEVTSLGLVQMTRKRVGQGLLEVVLRAVRALPRPRRDRPHRPGRREAPQRRSGGGNGSGNGGGQRPAAPAAATGPAAAGRQGRRPRTTEAPPPRRPRPGRAGRATASRPRAPRTGSRRNRGRRGRGQSGEDRAAEDAAVLAGGQTDVEPDTEALGTTEAAADAGRRRRPVAEEPPAASRAPSRSSRRCRRRCRRSDGEPVAEARRSSRGPPAAAEAAAAAGPRRRRAASRAAPGRRSSRTRPAALGAGTPRRGLTGPCRPAVAAQVRWSGCTATARAPRVPPGQATAARPAPGDRSGLRAGTQS